MSGMASYTYQGLSALEKVLLDLAAIEKTFLRPGYEAIEPVLLIKELKEIVQKSNLDTTKAFNTQQKEALSERWKSIKASKQWDELTRRDLRDLVSIPEAFCDPQLLALIHSERPFNKRLLTTVFRAYLSHWQSLKVLRPKWSSLIAEALEQPDLIQRHWAAFHHWRKIAPWLLGENASEKLAQDLMYSTGSLSSAINSYLQIDVGCPVGSLGEHSRQFLLNGLLQLNKAQIRDTLSQALQYWVNPSDSAWLSSLILTVHRINDELLIEQVKIWFLHADKFGDLRLNPQGGWSQISPEAQQVFRSWLSQADLKFFFDFVIEDRNDEHGRKAFWMKYLNQVKNSRVLISPELRDNKQARLKEMRERGETQPGLISGSSTFIMETNDYYIVEFAKKPNAAYVYGKRDTQFKSTLQLIQKLLRFERVPSLSTESLRLGEVIPQISNQDAGIGYHNIRCFHRSGWENVLSRWLISRGIRP